MTLLTWKKTTHEFGSACNGRLGSIVAFSVFYNSLKPRGETGNSYVIAALLPGFKSTRYYADTEEDAMAKAETMCNNWIVAAGLKVGSDS